MATQFPPPGLPIPEFRTPDPTQVFYRVLIARTDPIWQNNAPLKRGTLYSSLSGADVKICAAYPELLFVRETVPIGSNTVAGMSQDQFVIWEFTTNPDSESTYNAEISQLGDAVGNPVYARPYTIRRDEYEANPTIATGSPLTALVGVEITDGGASYKRANAIFDCGGEGAEVEFVISDGVIISAVVTKEGSGFNIGTQLTIDGDGSGATGVPLIQPVEAILTSQKKVEFADGDPLSNEFVKVLRIYELLPGPWIPRTRYDIWLGPVQMRSRAVLNVGQQGGQITPTGSTNYDGRDGSSVVLIETEENWSDGTGTPGNPIYPFQRWATYSDARGDVVHTSQIQLAPFQPPEATLDHNVSSGVWTKVWFEPYADNPFLIKRFTEEWFDVIVNDQLLTSEFGGAIANATERTSEPGQQSPERGLMVIDSKTVTTSPEEQTLRTVKNPESAWPILPGSHTDERTGIVIGFTKQVVDANTPIPPRSGCRGPFVEQQPYDWDKKIQIISAVDLNSLPPAETWMTTRPFNLPPTLLSVEAIWSDVVGKFADATKNSVSVQVSSGASGGIIVTAINGFRGYAKAQVTRKYYFCKPPDSEILTPVNIRPSSGSVVLTDTNSTTFSSGADEDSGPITNTSNFSESDAGGRVGDHFQRQVAAVDIRDHLVGIFQIINPQHRSQPVNAIGNSGGGVTRGVSAAGTLCQMEVRIPQSTPSGIFSGQTLLTEVEVEEWRLNVWVLQEYRVIVP